MTTKVRPYPRSERWRELEAASRRVEAEARDGDDTAIERYMALIQAAYDVAAKSEARSVGKENSERDKAARDARSTLAVADYLMRRYPSLRNASSKSEVGNAVEHLNTARPTALPAAVRDWVQRQPLGVTDANVKRLLTRWRERKIRRPKHTPRTPLTDDMLRTIFPGLPRAKK